MTKDDDDDRKLWRQRVTGSRSQLRETELMLAICVVKADRDDIRHGLDSIPQGDAGL